MAIKNPLSVYTINVFYMVIIQNTDLMCYLMVIISKTVLMPIIVTVLTIFKVI